MAGRSLRRPLVVGTAEEEEEVAVKKADVPLSGKEWLMLVSSSSALRWCRDRVTFERRE